jgi:hypothetical protein
MTACGKETLRETPGMIILSLYSLSTAGREDAEEGSKLIRVAQDYFYEAGGDETRSNTYLRTNLVGTLYA